MPDTARIHREPHFALLIRRPRPSAARSEEVNFLFRTMRAFVNETILVLLALESIDIARMLAETKMDGRLVGKRQCPFLKVEPSPHFGILPEQRHDMIRTKFIHRPPEDETRRSGILHPAQ